MQTEDAKLRGQMYRENTRGLEILDVILFLCYGWFFRENFLG